MRSAAIRFFGTACLLASSTLLAVYAVETYLTLNDPFAAPSVSRRVEGLRRRGYDAYPAYVVWRWLGSPSRVGAAAAGAVSSRKKLDVPPGTATGVAE